jgi:spore coat protein U-like protein
MTQSPLAAPSACSVSATPVSFGVYSVFSISPNNSGGSITIGCNKWGGAVEVNLSTGQSNRYAMRIMNSGGNLLNYNLYTDIARTMVWGDGTGGSKLMKVTREGATSLPIFGQIPAEQDAFIGNYADNITAIVNF